MDRFLNQQNIERYQKLVDTATDATQRATIFKLLNEEQSKFRQSLAQAPNRRPEQSPEFAMN